MAVNSRIPSFTEKALLHPVALEWLCPSNCEKRPILLKGDSVLKTLANYDFSSILNLKDSYWHWGTKPVRVVGRTFYTALVLGTLAPTGALYHGLKIAKHLSAYGIAVLYTHNEEAAKTEWKKTAQYATPFFTDLTSCMIGVSLTALTGVMLWSVIPLAFNSVSLISERIIWFVGPILLAGITTHFFGGFDPALMIPSLVAESDVRVGMYFSLAMRNQLGLVGENDADALIPFSSKDQFEYDRISNFSQSKVFYQLKEEVRVHVTNLIIERERALIKLIREANEWIVANGGKHIEYAYPFNGEVVAKLVKDLPASNNAANVKDLLVRLRTLNREVNIWKDVFRNAQKITIEDSTFATIVKICCGRSTDFIVPLVKSYISEKEYKTLFHNPI